MFAIVLVATLCREPAPARAAFDRGAPVPYELITQSASLDARARADAVEALAALGTPAAHNLLVVMLQRDIDPLVRIAAAAALGASHDAGVADALDYAARADSDAEVRAAAAAARDAVVPFGRRPKLAAGLSVLCPGCGHFYLRRPGVALGFLASTAALIAAGVAVQNDTPFEDPGRATPLYIGAQNLWSYSVFASYRDARLARGDYGYRYPVARETLPELVFAPFNPKVLKSPYVWAGVPALLAAASGFVYLISQFDSSYSFSGDGRRTLGDPGGVRFFGKEYQTTTGFALGEAYFMSLFVPVGIGEEALFRGVIQAGLSETSLGLWGGWAVGSLIFGSIHALNFIGQPNGFKTTAIAVPFITATGSYLGYVFIRKNFSLAASTAIHFWYDFALSTIGFVFDPDNQPFNVRIGLPF